MNDECFFEYILCLNPVGVEFIHSNLQFTPAIAHNAAGNEITVEDMAHSQTHWGCN